MTESIAATLLTLLFLWVPFQASRLIAPKLLLPAQIILGFNFIYFVSISLLAVGLFRLDIITALLLFSIYLVWRNKLKLFHIEKSSSYLKFNPYSISFWCLSLGGLIVTARALVYLPLVWDSQMYHLPKAAYWVQKGSFIPLRAPGAWESYEDLFGGGEMFFAWVMLASNTEYFISFLEVLLWGGTLLNVIGLGRLLNLENNLCYRGAALFLIHPLSLLLTGVAHVEAFSFYFLSSSLYCFTKYNDLKRESSYLYLGLLSLGLLTAVKITGSLIAVGVYLGFFYRERILFHIRSLLIGSIPIVPWLIKNFLFAKGILSPFHLNLLGYSLGVASSNTLREIVHLKDSYDFWRHVQSLFAIDTYQYQLTPWALFLLLGVLFFVLPVFFRSASGSRVKTLCFIGVVTPLIIVFEFFFLAGDMIVASGTGISRLMFPYLLPTSIAVGFLANQQKGGVILADTLILLCTCLSVLFGCFRFYIGPVTWSYGIGPFSLHIIGVASAIAVLTIICFKFKLKSVALISLIIALAGNYTWKYISRPRQYKTAFPYHPYPNYYLQAASYLRFRQASKITFLFGSSTNSTLQFFYPFLGQWLQHQIVYETPRLDGLAYEPALGPLRDFNFTAWVTRLKAREIKYIIFFEPKGDEFMYLEKEKKLTKRLFGDKEGWGFYEVK